MKTTVNTAELKELGACTEGYDTFYAAHGDKEVKLSEALDSNGWDDIWWYLTEAWESISKQQQDDINLLGCNWSERCLHRFEEKFPDDKRPRLAIEAKRNFIAGEIDEADLEEAESAAWSAERSAAWSAERSAAWSAAWSAARSAASAARSAWSAARSAESAESAALEEMKSDLRELFVKWESEQ